MDILEWSRHIVSKRQVTFLIWKYPFKSLRMLLSLSLMGTLTGQFVSITLETHSRPALSSWVTFLIWTGPFKSLRMLLSLTLIVILTSHLCSITLEGHSWPAFNSWVIFLIWTGPFVSITLVTHSWPAFTSWVIFLIWTCQGCCCPYPWWSYWQAILSQ